MKVIQIICAKSHKQTCLGQVWRERVGMTAEKAKTLAAQRFGPAQIDSDNQMITVSKAVLTENCAGGFGVKARKTPPGDHPL